MAEISPHNLGYSLNNIPHPTEDTYLKKLIKQTESFIKRVRTRWRTFWYENLHEQPDSSTNPRPTPTNHETWFKTNTTPPQHPDLQHFETELYYLIRTIQFTPLILKANSNNR